MSIEGSDTSSHIRQFGLYRTIDAKTEEFLKLSKRRQIKQGCACAAISTVITVAIVIGVIIIYEYSTIYNSKPKNNLRQNWLSLMNSSLEAMPFEVKFDKTKLNPATFQILPLILKTIKKNVYFDKIIEDSVNLSTTIDKKESTEETSYKNAPESTNNWVRFPVSKLYTIEYKTSPIFYFTNPSKKIEYFAKIRKIRDYQRVMNYVDKMISDKVSLGTTIPMAKYIYNAYRIPSVEYTTPKIKAKRGDEKFKTIKKKLITTETKESKCSCKESIKDLLSKFITHLKELLPSAIDEAHKNTKTTTPCKVQQSIKQVKAYDKEIQTINNLLNNFLHDTPTEILEQNSRLSEKYQIKHEKQHNFNKYIKPEESRIDTSKKYDYSYKTFITKQNLIVPYIKSNSNKHQSMTIKNVENKSIQNKEITTFPDLQTNYKDYTSTESNIIDYFKVLDAHSLELVKRKIIPRRKKVDLIKDKSDKSIMKNISSFLPVYNTSEPGPKAVFFNDSEINDSGYINIIPTTYTTARSDFIDTTIQQFTTDTTLDKLVTERSYNSSTVKDSIFAFDNLTLEEEIYKISTETPEISIKNLENMIKKSNSSTVYSNSNIASEYEWELVNVVDDKYNEDVPNSMIPQSRSSYLEIQRNEWKNEQQHDYDNNLNNYLFE